MPESVPVKNLTLDKFNYHLPQELISQKPIKPRDHARLLILDKNTGATQHKKFYQIGDYLNPGDVIVLNNSKVIPARLLGKKSTGGKVEIFLLKKQTRPKQNIWQCLIKGKIKPDQKIIFKKDITAQVINQKNDINRLATVKFNCSDKKLFSIGHTPTPPYIKTKAKLTDYQTVYAKTPGSVAAPTAGLHFTKKLISQLKKKGIKFEFITLHVGLGTFAPVKAKNVQFHQISAEFCMISPSTARRLNSAKEAGHKIIACGTTSVRTLESFTKNKKIIPQENWTNIFIYPGYKFKFVDAIITNFHLPKSTLLMLVSAFTSTNLIKKTYATAIDKKYRFYSFGDAMLIK